MADVNLPHSSAGLAVTEQKETLNGQAQEQSKQFPPTREYYKFFDDIKICIDQLNTRLEQVESRLTAGGL